MTQPASERPAPSQGAPTHKPGGLARLGPALANSLSGFRLAWAEPAFRQEVGVAVVAVPAAMWVGRSWVEAALLMAVVALVLITELLNTGIEAAIDRIGPEWHAQAKRAKDVASAAVLISLLLCGGVWLAALWVRLA